VRMPAPAEIARAAARLAFAAAIAATVARALRPPNGYATAHWLLNYDLGFVRRGLPGAVLSLLTGGNVTPAAITVAAFVLLGALALLTLVVCDRALSRSGGDPALPLVLTAFLTSPFWVMNAHLAGYYDTLAYAAQIAALLLLRSGRPRAGALLLGLTVLAHENVLVTGFPLLLLAWQGGWNRDRAGRPAPFAWAMSPLVVFLFLSAVGTRLAGDNFTERLGEHLRGYPFVSEGWDRHLPLWLSWSFGHYFRMCSGDGLYRLLHDKMHGLMLPATIALLGAAVECGRLGRAPLRLLGVIAAVGLPLGLNFVAWDMARFWTIILIQAFLACWIVLEQTPSPRRVPALVTLLAGLAVALNVLRVNPLYDGLEEWLNLKARVLLFLPCAAGLALHAFLRWRAPRPAPDDGDSA
jgi:hypothetical protein